MTTKADIFDSGSKELSRFFDVHITNHCQLSCRHCYLPQKNTRHMSLDMFQVLCHDFMNLQHPIKKVDIILSGGEPLIHPEFPKFVEYLRSINHPIRLSSNGILIPKYLHLFHKRDGIQVSIDGNEKVHNYIRGPKVYEYAVEALLKLNKAGINHSITMALCQENFDCIDDVLALCKDTGTGTLNITLFQPHDNTSLKPISYETWVTTCNHVRDVIKEKKLPIYIPNTCIQQGCIAGILGLSVLPDGTYWDCSRSQKQIGVYPTKFKDVMNWDLINTRGSLNSLDTCCQTLEK